MIRKTSKSDALLIPIIDVKQHLRVDSTFDDAIIYQIIRASQDYAEKHTGRALVLNSYEFTFSDDPVREPISNLSPCQPSERIVLRVGEVTEITSINTYDTAGAATSVSVSGYDIINYDQFTEIIRKDGEDVPRGTRSYRDFVMVFKAGYTEATLPFFLRQAILALCDFYYECRDGLADGSVKEPDHTIRALLIKARMETL